jgi:hypothetical protein
MRILDHYSLDFSSVIKTLLNESGAKIYRIPVAGIMLFIPSYQQSWFINNIADSVKARIFDTNSLDTAFEYCITFRKALLKSVDISIN